MMDPRHKRLAAAKKKLQEYKNQKSKHENHEVDTDVNQRPAEGGTGDKTMENVCENGHDVSILDTPQQYIADTDVETGDIRIQNSLPEAHDVVNVSQSAFVQQSQDAVIEESSVHFNGTVVSSDNTISRSSPEEVLEEEIASIKFSVRKQEKETQCDSDGNDVDVFMQESLADLQNELSKVRSENSKLFHREMELVQQLETSEKVIRDLRKEVNHFKEQGSQLHQLEDMQQAVAVLSKSKVALAEQLSNEQDRINQLLESTTAYHSQVQGLQMENNQLRSDINNMKSRLEESLIKNQLLEDQRRHFGSQIESLETKLYAAASEASSDHGHSHRGGSSHKYNDSQDTRVGSESNAEVPNGQLNHRDTGSHVDHARDRSEYDDHNHSHGSPETPSHIHSQAECDHGHVQEDDHERDHEHHHERVHEHEHGHDHSTHEHEHGHDHSTHEHSPDRYIITQKFYEMEKTLKRLQWENTTYEAELVKLGPLKHMEPRVRELEERNRSLQQEVDRLEHLVIQLQGENDTIGDYITLYQTQKLALREHAKENEVLVETLSRERNELLLKLSELNLAVEKLAEKKSANCEEIGLENQIRDLIHNVNTKVHEPYSCSVCSGSRMMTV